MDYVILNRHYITHHEWDLAGRRVNTAIVSSGMQPAAADVKLVWVAAGPSHRPALGVRQIIGGTLTWVFSFHAISPGGPDAAQMVAAIAASAAPEPWFIGADWNRGPRTFALPAGSVFCPPRGSTHPVRHPVSMFDYFVRSGAAAAEGEPISLICSDHYPVAFMFP